MPHLRAAGNRHPLQSVWQSLVRRELEGTVDHQEQQQQQAQAELPQQQQQQQQQPLTEFSQRPNEPAAWDGVGAPVTSQQGRDAYHHPQPAAAGPSLPNGLAQVGTAGAYAQVDDALGYGEQEEEEEEFLQATPSQTGSDEAPTDWEPGMIA